jgi:hypothetical protein
VSTKLREGGPPKQHTHISPRLAESKWSERIERALLLGSDCPESASFQCLGGLFACIWNRSRCAFPRMYPGCGKAYCFAFVMSLVEVLLCLDRRRCRLMFLFSFFSRASLSHSLDTYQSMEIRNMRLRMAMAVAVALCLWPGVASRGSSSSSSGGGSEEKGAAPPFFLQDPTDSLCLAGEEFKRCSIDTLFYVVGSPGTCLRCHSLLLSFLNKRVVSLDACTHARARCIVVSILVLVLYSIASITCFSSAFLFSRNHPHHRCYCK